MATIGSLVIKLALDSKEFVSGFDTSVKRLGKIGSDFQQLGSKLSLGITAPLTAIGGLALKTATDFESGFAGVRKTVDATEEEFSILRKDLVGMTQEIPASADRIFQVAEAAGQLGVQKGNIAAFTRTMVDLGNTTNITAEEGASALARLANITGLPQTQFSNLGASLVALGNNLATTEAEILEMSLRLAGAGKTAGLSVANITGLAGALTSVGINAEAGGTAFSKLIIEMAGAVETGGAAVEGFARVAGQTAEEFAANFRSKPAEALQSFVAGLSEVKASGGSLFATLDELGLKEVRLRDSLLRSANAPEVFAKSMDLSSEAFQKNTALAEEAQKRYDTTASKMDVFQNRIAAISANLGEKLLPVLERLLDKATPFLQWVDDVITAFGKLDPGIQGVVLAFTVAFAATGPILLVIGAFMTALSGVLLTPLLTGGAIVVGIATGIAAIISYWDEIKQIPETVKVYLVEKVMANLENFRAAWASLKSNVLGITESMFAGIKKSFEFLDGLKNTVSGFTEGVTGFFQKMGTVIQFRSIVPDMIDGIQAEFGRLDAAMVQPSMVATGRVSRNFEQMDGQMQKTLQGVEQVGASVWSSLSSGFANATTAIIDGTFVLGDFLMQVLQHMLVTTTNFVLQQLAQWGLLASGFQTAQDAQLVAFTATESAKTAVQGAQDTARVAMGVATNKVILAGVITTLAGIAAVGQAAMATAAAVVATTSAVFAAIGSALVASVVGAPLAPAYFAAAKMVAFIGGAAVGAGTAAIQEALGAAIVAASTALATPFAEGGLVTGPVFGLVGEAGPELITPLDQARDLFGESRGEQTIIIEMDGRRLTERIMPHFPKVVRMKLGAAL